MVVFYSQDTLSEEPNDEDVVLIKEETSGEEAMNGTDTTDNNLLLNEDGKRGNIPDTRN